MAVDRTKAKPPLDSAPADRAPAGLTNGTETGSRPRFTPGGEPGPGRPKGSRSKLAAMLDDAVTDEERKAVLQAIVSKAKDGDTQAASMLFARWWPVPKGRPVSVDLPELTEIEPANIPRLVAALFNAAARGEITTDEAQDLAGILEAQRKAVELSEVIPKLRELESQARNKRR